MFTILARSEVHWYRYRTLVSEGDTHSFKTLCDLNAGQGPYSWVSNHYGGGYQPGLQTLLYSAAQTEGNMKEPTITKTGEIVWKSRVACAKGFPDSVIDKLTAYYGQKTHKIF